MSEEIAGVCTDVNITAIVKDSLTHGRLCPCEHRSFSTSA